MIDYETFCQIKSWHDERGLSATQIAAQLVLDSRTVTKWLGESRYHPRQTQKRPSKLDPHKARIKSLLECHQYSAVQIFQQIKEEGYSGEYSILKDYVRSVRPKRYKAYLTLHFEPGECAQVDWGSYGTAQAGNTTRRLSFFVMVLCYSRLMYVEFTLSQTMEHFLACHQNAFRYFGGIPERIMVDNLKSAVLKRLIGEAPVFNPRYLDFANHYGFKIKACGVAKGNEKGRVENGVGYVKKNLLNGLDIPDFSCLNSAAKTWLEDIANVRIHGQTHKQPKALFTQQERARLRPLPSQDFDVARVLQVRATNRFRVAFDSNHYSVPAEYASQNLVLKAYPERLCVYHNNKLIARHVRSFEHHRDFEDPDHPRELLTYRRNARRQKYLKRFLTLSIHAEDYYQALKEKRMNAGHHVQKIIALCEIYGDDAVARALDDVANYKAFSCEYVANLLEQRARHRPAPGALHLTRSQDQLEIDVPEPDLSIYQPESKP